ncbi:MAG: DUF302 domain-containing protein [Campylobacterota bacterium]|nr:DUF302 domain-containing protein [Campylobacterota bacterium]
MKNNKFLSALALVSALLFTGCTNEVYTPKAQTAKAQETRDDIRIYAASNSDGKITKESIEAAFKANGFTITGNNDMNAAFKGRFGKDHPDAGTDMNMYRLMFVYNPKISSKLIKNYPLAGLLAPLSTSVFSKDGSTINISSLSLEGMSRITKVPMDNPNLVALSQSMTKALKEALPNGEFKKLSYKKVRPDGEIVTKFKFIMNNESDDIEEAKETYQETMEGEIESNGFIVAGFTSVLDDLEANGVEGFDFYDSYSICKLEVIYPVHKTHPEVGALAPCTMFMYKKSDEKFTYMGYPSVYNWIMTTNIEDDYSLEPLIDAQNLLESTVDSTIE